MPTSMLNLRFLLLLPCWVPHAFAVYGPLREYAGATFFDEWAYYGNIDNTTWGNVTFVDKDTASRKRLTYVNGVGNAIIKVDAETAIMPDKLVHRDSVRLTSLHSYGVGTLILIDVVHIPYGCSVWPSFWMYGMQAEWPNAGEIDIIEGINDMPNNQIALHALGGCVKTEAPGTQTGVTLEGDCAKPEGCIVAETKPNSYGAAFAEVGGGVFALQMEESGIYSWFWSRPDIPPNVNDDDYRAQRINTSDWGIPTAAYPAGKCDIKKFFPPQNLVLLTTLCGVWAGVPDIYQSNCNTPTGSCVVDNIMGSGEKFGTAYWEIKYIRVLINKDTASSTTASTTATKTTAGEADPRNTQLSSSFKLKFPSRFTTMFTILVPLILRLSCE